MNNYRASILVGLNCSMSPAPEAIATLMRAQRLALREGINSSIAMEKQAISGFLMANAIAHDVITKEEYTHMMFTADDIKVPDDFITKLVDADKDIISGTYVRRGYDDLLGVLEDGDVAGHLEAKDIAEAKMCPGHSMLVKKHVLIEVANKFKELTYRVRDGRDVVAIFMPFIHRGALISDDYAFSLRAKTCGFSCWIDFGMRFEHRTEVWQKVPDKLEKK